MRPYLAAILVMFLMVFTTVKAQNSIGYSLNKNQVFNIQQQAKQQLINTVANQQQEITNTIEGTMSFKVENASQNEYKLSMVFKRFKMKSVSSLIGTLFEVDTQVTDTLDPMNKTFKALLNKPIYFTMNKQGKISNVNGTQKLVNSMLKGFEGLVTQETLDHIKVSLENDFGAEALANSFEQMTFFYPTHPIKIGETWKNSYSGNVSALNTWKLVQKDSSQITIAGESAVKLNSDDDDVLMQLEGKQKTTIICDSKSGFLTKMTVTQDTKGTSIYKNIDPNTKTPTILKATITYKRI